MAIEGNDRPELDAVRRILDLAQRGGEEGEGEEGSGELQRPKVFTGRAQRLTDDPLPVPAAASLAIPSSNDPSESGVTVRTLTFWRNGFTVAENGPLYQYDNPESQRLLSLLQSGHAPLQLLNVAPGQRVDLRVAHQMNQDFSPPKPTLSAFSGRGQRLGDFSEPVRPAESPTESSSPSPTVDPNRPTTSLQLRLANGSRQNVTFNTDARVSQVHEFVASLADRPFILLAGRPPTTLAPGDSRTLAEASLVNTVIIQQYQ